MNAAMYYVGGSKGGVGKSKLSFALIDYLFAQEKKILLLETDTSNPDVYKTHHPHESDSLISKIIDLDVSEGWIKLVNYADERGGPRCSDRKQRFISLSFSSLGCLY